MNFCFEVIDCDFPPKTGLLNQLLPSKFNCLWTDGQVFQCKMPSFCNVLSKFSFYLSLFVLKDGECKLMLTLFVKRNIIYVQ